MEELFSSCEEGGEFSLNGFARELALLCDEKTESLDEVISRYLNNWKIGRLPRLTLAALRCAVCELLYREDIPVAVTINEAVEFLKKYASQEDAIFANGVLGALVKVENVEKTAEEKGEPEK